MSGICNKIILDYLLFWHTIQSSTTNNTKESEMLTNKDGTLFQLYTVFEEIDSRAKKETWPSFSDICGADFMMGSNHGGDPAKYVQFAKDAARYFYPNSNGD